MFNYRYGRRLDNVDYENVGFAIRWCFSDTVILLTSFEMEVKGYNYRPDSKDVYSRIHTRYFDYVWDSLVNDVIEYDDGLSEDDRERSKENGSIKSFDIDRANFKQEDFLSFLEKDDRIKLDIRKLKRYLSGDEAPAAHPAEDGQRVTLKASGITPKVVPPIPEDNGKQGMLSNDTQGHQGKDVASKDDAPDADIANMGMISHQKYRFEKTVQSWNLQFGKVKLDGVKNLVGMDYIKLLLSSPGVPISVFDMQIMLNPEYIKAPRGRTDGAFDTEEDTDTYSTHGEGKSTSKTKSLGNLRKRLLELSKERNELDPDYDHQELESIDNEVARIEQEIDIIQYSKDEDPEVKRNRDKIKKNIGDAQKNIKDLELKKGFPDTPIFNFLKDHITTGNMCVYNPPMYQPPEWSF